MKVLRYYYYYFLHFLQLLLLGKALALALFPRHYINIGLLCVVCRGVFYSPYPSPFSLLTSLLFALLCLMPHKKLLTFFSSYNNYVLWANGVDDNFLLFFTCKYYISGFCRAFVAVGVGQRVTTFLLLEGVKPQKI